MKKNSFIVWGIGLGLLAFVAGAAVAKIFMLLGLIEAARDVGISFGSQIFSALVLAPIFETLLMWICFKVLGRILSPGRAWILVGILMAGAHALHQMEWGLIVLIPFILYARVLNLTRFEMKQRVLIIAVGHFINNFLAVCFMAFF